MEQVGRCCSVGLRKLSHEILGYTVLDILSDGTRFPPELFLSMAAELHHLAVFHARDVSVAELYNQAMR